MRLKLHCWYYMAGIDPSGGLYDGNVYRIEGFQYRRDNGERDPTCYMYTSGPWPKPTPDHWVEDPEYWLNSNGVYPHAVARELPALEATIYEGMYQAYKMKSYQARRGRKGRPVNSGGKP